VIIFFVLISLLEERCEGPVIKVVFIPNLLNASAISNPCLPLDSFEIYLTGSKYSLVGPAVTKAFRFLLLIIFFLLKYF